MLKRFALAASVIAAAIAASVPSAKAEAPYPSSTINFIVTLAPGNTVDVIARLYADKVSKILGQSVVVVNRTGAGGLIAAQTVAAAQPDGYTILVTNSGHAILGVVNKHLPFDPIKDFAGISMVASAPALVAVTPGLHVKTLEEFVTLAKQKPGSINFGSAGIGTATHLAGSYFAYKTGIQLVHVPYKNGAEILTDMVSGRIQATFAPYAFLAPMLVDKLQALAVATPDAMTTPVAIPTARSSGVDYIYSTWYGFLAPAKMPAANRKILADAMLQASQDPDLAAKILAQGLVPQVIQLGAFDQYIDNDMQRLGPVLADLGTSLR